MSEVNVMQRIGIGKVTFNFGSGVDQGKLEKGMLLIKHITGRTPIKTTTNKRIPGWGLRPGLPVGCKLTLRDGNVRDLIRRILMVKKNVLSRRQFDDNGSVAIGVHEYIDIPEVEYEPKIGILGFEMCITLERPGFRVKSRRLRKAKIPKRHRISRDDAIGYMQKEFNITIGD
jgi:large subunit ribosomal protein L5